MSSEWKTNKTMCEYDILLYGILLHPCLYGENTSHMVKHPSCVSHTLSYTGLGLSGSCLGSMLGYLIFPGSEFWLSLCSTMGTSIFIGTYAGNMRTRLRKKYNIEGDKCDDMIAHAICSPCAICQEAQEIRNRDSDSNEYRNIQSEEWKPIPQEMTRK